MDGLPVATEVWRGLLASLLLTGTALSSGIFVGIPLGILSAVRQYSKLDFLLTGITFLGISLPSFLLGDRRPVPLRAQFKIVPIAGMTTVGKPFDFVDFIRHLALPALILGFGYVAIFMRYTRASMLEVIHSDYITTATLEGPAASDRPVPPRLPQRPHPDHHDHRPVDPQIVGAAVVTETVFAWPGLGLMMVEGVNQRDFLADHGRHDRPGDVVLVVNLLTDIAYGYADPRIRYS